MILILIFIGFLCQIFHMECTFIKNNRRINLNFTCYENADPDDTCSAKKGYKDCDIIIELCVTTNLDRYLAFKNCDLYEETYNVTNKRGFCLKGLEDTRDNLKDMVKFEANSVKIRILLRINIFPRSEKRRIEVSIFYHDLTEDKTENRFEMDNYYKKDNTYLTIKMATKYECLPNFSGDWCQIMCLDPGKYYNCEADNGSICLNDWQWKNCSQPDDKERFEKCRCTFSKDAITNKCGEEFISCLRDSLQCKVNSNNKTCSAISDAHQTPYLEKSTIAIIVVVSGLILIIFILLATLLIILRKNKKNAEQIPRNINPVTPNKSPAPVLRMVNTRRLPSIPISDEYLKPGDDYEEMKDPCRQPLSSSIMIYN